MRTGDSAAAVAAEEHGSWAVDVIEEGRLRIPRDRAVAVVEHRRFLLRVVVVVGVEASSGHHLASVVHCWEGMGMELFHL